MRKLFVAALVITVMLIGVTVNAEVMLFKGDPLATAGITLGGWGSGSAVEASERPYEGSRSIKVVSQGLHQGGRIDFKTPVEIIEAPASMDDYLQFTLNFTSVVRIGTSPFTAMGFGITSAPGVSILPSASSTYYYEDEVPVRAKVNTMRIVVVPTNGPAIDCLSDVPAVSPDGWYKIAIPFKVLGILKAQSFKVSRLAVFTDLPETFYVGEVSSVRDTTPISVQEGDEQVVAANDIVTLQASAEGGSSMLHYAWNFGDGYKDGEDASGPVVSHQFKTPGDFNVTLVVSDIWGIKKSATTTYKVSVN
jgi:hypothetical protein